MKEDKRDLKTPSGSSVFVSVGGGEPEPDELIEAAHDDIRAVPASEEMRDFACGHRGPSLYHMDLYGQVLHNNGTSPEKCGECAAAWFRSITCRCSLCGLAILPGGGVALYDYSRKMKPERVTEVASGAIGCMRWFCCPSGGFFAGHWTGTGFRSAFAGGGTIVDEVARTGEAAVGVPDGMAAAQVPEEPRLPPRPPRRPWYRRLWNRVGGR